MFENDLGEEQQKIFGYWQYVEKINKLLIQCVGYNLTFTLNEIDKIDTSNSSYYDVIITKARDLPISENPYINTSESLHDLTLTQNGLGKDFINYKSKFDETMRKISYLDSYKVFYKTHNNVYGFLDLQNRIQIILQSISGAFHIQYINQTPEGIEFDEDIQEYVLFTPSNFEIEDTISENKDLIEQRKKVHSTIQLDSDYFEKKKDEARMWAQVYEDAYDYNDK
jgi:hypothetical protein